MMHFGVTPEETGRLMNRQYLHMMHFGVTPEETGRLMNRQYSGENP